MTNAHLTRNKTNNYDSLHTSMIKLCTKLHWFGSVDKIPEKFKEVDRRFARCISWISLKKFPLKRFFSNLIRFFPTIVTSLHKLLKAFTHQNIVTANFWIWKNKNTRTTNSTKQWIRLYVWKIYLKQLPCETRGCSFRSQRTCPIFRIRWNPERRLGIRPTPNGESSSGKGKTWIVWT